jgi:hypothetical protein
MLLQTQTSNVNTNNLILYAFIIAPPMFPHHIYYNKPKSGKKQRGRAEDKRQQSQQKARRGKAYAVRLSYLHQQKIKDSSCVFYCGYIS